MRQTELELEEGYHFINYIEERVEPNINAKQCVCMPIGLNTIE